MAKPKTMIIYAASASIAAIAAAIAPARERGQAVRLIALEEFRGETEQSAGAVFVERRDGDELVFDRIQQAYPMIQVQDWGEGADVEDNSTFVPVQQDDELRNLRLQLIALGGSAPAGADAAQLANLIAAQRAAMHHHPILPNAATQGTTIPDPTPILQRQTGDQLVDERATGSTAPVLAAAEEVAGEPVTGSQTAGASSSVATSGELSGGGIREDTVADRTDSTGTAPGTGGASGGGMGTTSASDVAAAGSASGTGSGTDQGGGDTASAGGGDSFDADAFINRNLGDISDAEIAGLSDAQKAAIVAAERDREQPRVTLLDKLGVARS